MRRACALVPLIFGGTPLACVGHGEETTNEGFEIDCRGVPCDWVVVEGDARFGATWHDGDLGVDLSGRGRSVIEQRSVMLLLTTRQLDLEASILRDANVRLHFELDWYGRGSAEGKTFWERAPVFLKKVSVDVFEQGVFNLARKVAVPSEAAALVFRVVKEGDGRAMIDELTLGHANRGKK